MSNDEMLDAKIEDLSKQISTMGLTATSDEAILRDWLQELKTLRANKPKPKVRRIYTVMEGESRAFTYDHNITYSGTNFDDAQRKFLAWFDWLDSLRAEYINPTDCEDTKRYTCFEYKQKLVDALTEMSNGKRKELSIGIDDIGCDYDELADISISVCEETDAE